MRVHYLQHVAFEGIGAITEWAHARGHTLSGTQLFRDTLPEPDELDLLVIMGGPMNIYEEREYPWLAPEKTFIAKAIDAHKAVLGICLGAQLLADVLGGTVTKGEYREIGWYPVELTEAGRQLPVLAGFPQCFPALHWHGDTFSTPRGAIHVASSAACTNQAFAYDGGRVLGLQFHLEETRVSLAQLIEHAGHELVDGAWISTADEMLAPDAPFMPSRELMFALLDSMVARQAASV